MLVLDEILKFILTIFSAKVEDNDSALWLALLKVEGFAKLLVVCEYSGF